MHYDILIKNCTMLDPDLNAVENRTIAISGGKIAAIGGDELVGTAGEVIDGHNRLFMPGLTDSHTHMCQQLLRGRILDELPMIWTRIMLPFESTLTEELVDISARLACLEMIKSGTTSFADAGGLFMHRAAQATLDAGLRGTLTCSTIDLGNLPPSMKSTPEEAIARNTSLYREFHGEGDGRLSVFFSIRAMLSCSENMTVRAFEAARQFDTGVHAHISEYPGEVNACLEQHRMRPLEYLDSLGILDTRLLAAHGILLSEDEIALAGERGVKVAHCPFSNSGKGVPPTSSLLRHGIPVGLGTDGAAHGGLSLWNEMKIFRSLMNAHVGAVQANPNIMPAKTLLKMATRGGVAAYGANDAPGALEVGRRADLISIDLDQAHIMPSSNLTNTLVETVHAGDVRDMIVDGKLIMRERVVLTLDEQEVLARARAAHEKLFGTSARTEGVA